MAIEHIGRAGQWSAANPSCMAPGLSRDYAAVTARIERLTRNLFATIIALLIVTLILFAKEANELYEKNYPKQAASVSGQIMKHLGSY